MKTFPHFLIIAGTGRKTGKTKLSCAIINRLSNDFSVTAIKISPHFHQGSEEMVLVMKNDHFGLYTEQLKTRGKDSSRMLEAGAGIVYYMEVKDEHLAEAAHELVHLVRPSTPIVIESPGLFSFLKPAILIVTDHPDQVSKKKDVLAFMPQADLLFDLSKHDVESVAGLIHYTPLQGWKLKA